MIDSLIMHLFKDLASHGPEVTLYGLLLVFGFIYLRQKNKAAHTRLDKMDKKITPIMEKDQEQDVEITEINGKLSILSAGQASIESKLEAGIKRNDDQLQIIIKKLME